MLRTVMWKLDQYSTIVRPKFEKSMKKEKGTLGAQRLFQHFNCICFKRSTSVQQTLIIFKSCSSSCKASNEVFLVENKNIEKQKCRIINHIVHLFDGKAIKKTRFLLYWLLRYLLLRPKLIRHFHFLTLLYTAFFLMIFCRCLFINKEN